MKVYLANFFKAGEAQEVQAAIAGRQKLGDISVIHVVRVEESLLLLSRSPSAAEIGKYIHHLRKPEALGNGVMVVEINNNYVTNLNGLKPALDAMFAAADLENSKNSLPVVPQPQPPPMALAPDADKPAAPAAPGNIPLIGIPLPRKIPETSLRLRDMIVPDALREQLSEAMRRSFREAGIAQNSNPITTLADNINVLISGPPGSGKKTLAHALALFYVQTGLVPKDAPLLTVDANLIASINPAQAETNLHIHLNHAGEGILVITEGHLLTGALVSEKLAAHMKNAPRNPVIILACPDGKFDELTKFAPRLPDHFARQYTLPSHDDATLAKILAQKAARDGFTLGQDATQKVENLIAAVRNNDNPAYANGHAVEKIYAATVGRYMERVHLAAETGGTSSTVGEKTAEKIIIAAHVPNTMTRPLFVAPNPIGIHHRP